MQSSDLVRLQSAGWNDEQIHLATQIIAYFNYINRIADGLGVDDEPWMSPPDELAREQWLGLKARFTRADFIRDS